MPGRLFQAVKSGIANQELTTALDSTFRRKPRVVNGTYLGRNRILVGGQEYSLQNTSSTPLAKGDIVAVHNIGRKAAAIYAPADLPAGYSSTGGRPYTYISGVTEHSALSGLTTGDDHPQYGLLTGTETITGLWTFDRGASAPFAVLSGSAKVTHLNSDKLDGLDSTAFLSPQYLTLATNSNLSNERVLVAGSGLTLTDGGAGGNATLAVGAGTLLTVAADSVGITPGANYQFIGTGGGTAAGWRNVSELAGAGLAAATGVLAVGAGNGISVAADSVAVNQAYGFTWTAQHTFQADIQLDANLDFVGAQSITTTAGNLTVSPAGDLLLSPAGADVRVQSGVTLRSENYASQTTGWGIDYAGGADFRYLFADEMHVKAFIADLEQALAGGQIISKSVAMVATAFTAPAAGGTATLTVRDLPSASGMAAFQSGDIVRLRTFSRSAGALSVSDCWGVVTSYVNNGNGTQSWTFTRSTAPNAGGMTAGSQVQPDSIVLDYGTSGNGFYEVNAIDGTYGVNSPYAQVATWATHPASGTSVRTRLGNVKGITSQTEYGLWAGQNTTDKYLRLTDTNFEAHGLRVSLYNSGTERIRLDPAVPSIGLGATLPTGFGQAGIWMGRHSDGTYRLSVEESNGDQYLRWTHDGSRYYLDISGDIYLHDSPGAGGDDLGPTLAIGANGLISMGPEGHFRMHDGATPASNVKIDFHVDGSGNAFATIGDYLGGGNYLRYDGSTGDLIFKGKIIVTDGADFLPIEYRPKMTEFHSPYAAIVDANNLKVSVLGKLIVYTDAAYLLQVAPRYELIGRSGDTVVAMYVLKDGTQKQINDGGFRNVYGIDNPNGTTVEYFTIKQNAYASIPSAERANQVIIGYIHLNNSYSDIVSIQSLGEASQTIITPELIKTPSLAAISANLGNVTAGSIVVGSSNKLWLNDDTTAPTVALAIGGSTKASAPFLVYETGAFHAGGASANYVDWNGSTLIVKADIRADAGYLGSLTVNGNLTMNGGRLRWNSNNSYIDNSKIVISDVRSTVLVGDTSQLTLGLINIDLVDSGQGSWRYGVRVADGGNSLANVSSLYHGESAVAGAAAVDRIYNAQTSNGSYADGFYGEMHSYSGSDFNTSGVPFKGKHLTGGSVAVLNQSVDAGDVGTAPAVWIGSSAPNRSIVKVQTGATGQVGFHLDNPNAYSNFLALVTGNGDVSHGSGRGRFTVKGSTDTVGTPPSGEAYVYVKMVYVSRDNINEYRPCLCIKRDNGTEYYMVPYTNF